MVTIPLIKINQKGHVFFLMSADPRLIIKYCRYGDANALQDYQRPWNPKRVKEISNYVAGETLLNEKDYELGGTEEKKAIGIIPNCPLLNVVEDYIKINNGICTLELPDEPVLCFDILDGQHRLIAFNEDNNRLPDYEQYEMGFVVCNRLDKNMKKELFMVPNIKQEKVDRNVLLAMMQQLGLLNTKNTRNYLMIQALSDDESSPLYGKIKLGGKKIEKGPGIAPNTLLNILKKSKIVDKLGKDHDTQFRNMVIYLRAWDTVYPEKKTDSQHTLNKGLGLTYMLMIGPVVLNICNREKMKWTEENVVKVLQKLRNEITDPNQLFDRDVEGRVNPFSGQSSTEALAERDGQKLEELYQDAGFSAID